MKAAKVERDSMKRVNTRITPDQHAFIKNEVKKSKVFLTEGDVFRALLEEAITNRKGL